MNDLKELLGMTRDLKTVNYSQYKRQRILVQTGRRPSLKENSCQQNLVKFKRLVQIFRLRLEEIYLITGVSVFVLFQKQFMLARKYSRGNSSSIVNIKVLM